MTPIFYSFRRCPYAMRARLALAASGVEIEHREILLKDKPEAFLNTSPSGTVPCLKTADDVFDESLDIMKWALAQNDPEGWLDMPKEGHDWIARADGEFKHALDRTKYSSRYPAEEKAEHVAVASTFLRDLDAVLDPWIFAAPSLADYALLPFVRQFAFIDKDWFDAQDWPNVHAWLGEFLSSDRFAQIMIKHHVWEPKAASA